jgi:hypothetical protein
MPEPVDPTRPPAPRQVGYRIPTFEGQPLGGIENINEDLQLANDAQGVYVLLASRIVLHLSPDEAERISRVLAWHADRSRSCLAYARGETDA